MKYTVYVITNKLDGKKYVGATGDVDKRWYEHRRRAQKKETNFALHEAMRLHGLDNFDIAVLSTHPSKRIAFDAEIQTILALNTIEPNGYNMRVMGKALPEEHTEHIRTALRKEETRQLISQKLTVISNTPEMRAMRSMAALGRKHTPEAREKMGASKRGKAQSAAHIAALSAVRKGKTHSINQKLKVAKLTEADVKNIKLYLREGYQIKDIAAGFDVSTGAI